MFTSPSTIFLNISVYLAGYWTIIVLVHGLLSIQESGTLQTLHYGRAAKEGEPSWESPWGDGRPGWHIECSAMSAHYLGHVFDIHGGGKDLIFPHHENELAQSRAAYPESEVKCWMHNGFINIDDQKMSKSVNNFFTIRDIITLYHPLALRFFLMRTHYKSDANHSDKALEIASDRVYYIYQLCRLYMTAMKSCLCIVKRIYLSQSQPRSKNWLTTTIKLFWNQCQMIFELQMCWMASWSC
uniref:tRNA synthetases class I catalytic domain-containing protein n=1 Tax=Aegilops tauschii subsp. strangulata TaxID=200361 RepID=A0A453IZL9_AEGTS